MRILVVEDEKRLSDALCHILKEQKYMVDAVYDGDAGYDYAKSGIYDCIILDIMLPNRNGFEIAAALRREKNQTPILMLTARDTIPDKVKGLDFGADDYMTKPFSPDELLARIRVLSRRRGEVVLDEMSFGNLSFTISSCTLQCPDTGKSIRLNFKESELLKLLMARPEMILSKEEIINKVWGYDSDAGDNNVEAYISFLRKKVHFVGASVEIVSMKKLGYKLEKTTC